MYAATLYDAVYQFAVALNKTLMHNQSTDGTVLLKYLTDYSFESTYTMLIMVVVMVMLMTMMVKMLLVIW